jgi:hypothetical protein
MLPSIQVSTSLPAASMPSPTTRGLPVNPACSRWRSRAWMVPVQRRAGRLTVWPERMT